jgi:nucleosome binding factor SPN SPT16 subunit
MLTKIKPGISTRDVYHAALAFVKEKKPELEKNFVKNVGFGVGLSRSSKLSATHLISADWS